MMNLDFLPQWHIQQRKRAAQARRWKVALGLAACCVGVWSFAAGQALVQVKAQALQAQAAAASVQEKLDAALQMQYQIAVCERKISALRALAPTTTFSAALGEIFAMDCPRVAFSRLTLRREPIALPEKTAGVVRLVGAATDTAFDRPTQLLATIEGLSVDAAQCAGLLEQLESSAYFENVQPVYTRTRIIDQRSATEFEVRCRVADFQWKTNAPKQ